MSAQIGIESKNRQAVSNILNRVLANEYVLLVKTKNFHWNVAGTHFSELHKFFDEQYGQIAGFVDDVAERSRSLGEKTAGSLTEFLKLTSLKEHPGKHRESLSMVENLLNDHETIIRELRVDQEACSNKYKDAGTCDFLTGLMEEHEKMAWMLRSYLEE